MSITKIFVAGINHYDPSCRSQLIDWLNCLRATNSTAPSFIAVEASKRLYPKLQHQRDLFRQLAMTEFPGVSQEVIDTLVFTIYYEADSHLEVFPDAEVIWLDEDRPVNEYDELNNFAQVRLNIYKQHFVAGGNILMQISESEWDNEWERAPTTPLGEPDYHRDFRFHEIISRAMSSRNGDYAIAIMGASHAANRINSVLALLENDGITCNVNILKAA